MYGVERWGMGVDRDYRLQRVVSQVAVQHSRYICYSH